MYRNQNVNLDGTTIGIISVTDGILQQSNYHADLNNKVIRGKQIIVALKRKLWFD